MIRADELYGDIWCFKSSLQNCSVDYDTSPDFISSGGGEEDFISSGGGEEDFISSGGGEGRTWLTLTHHSEGDDRRGDGEQGFGVSRPACVFSHCLPKFVFLNCRQSQNGTAGLHHRVVVVPDEGGGRAGAGRTRQAEVGPGSEVRGRARRSDGDCFWSVCRGRNKR